MDLLSKKMGNTWISFPNRRVSCKNKLIAFENKLISFEYIWVAYKNNASEEVSFKIQLTLKQSLSNSIKIFFKFQLKSKDGKIKLIFNRWPGWAGLF